jgi:type IX secretion system PorP/SprF family membrane protein
MKKFSNLKIAINCMLVIMSTTVVAQQDAMFTHYMYNTLAVNPAYAGTRDALTVTALNRSQWVGFAGAPNTQTLTMHTPFKTKNVGLGLSVINDKIGPIRSTAFYADFAYMIKTGEKSKLSFGLKAGGSLFQANLNTLDLTNQSDVSFQNNTLSKVLPNFGFGMYYYREKFYAGISTPKLLQNNVKVATSAVAMKPEQRHFFFIMGTVFKLNDKLDLKPTTFIKVTEGAPIEADLTATFIINKKVLLGATFRTGDALAALVGYQINDQLLIGYSFDWSYGLQTMKYNGGSHEIMLRYDFHFKNKEKISSPRYF